MVNESRWDGGHHGHGVPALLAGRVKIADFGLPIVTELERSGLVFFEPRQ
jgi:hypothetical protein